MIEGATIQCPYCAQATTFEVDQSGGKAQHFEFDCEVCCRPIVCSLRVNGVDDLDIAVHTEAEV